MLPRLNLKLKVISRHMASERALLRRGALPSGWHSAAEWAKNAHPRLLSGSVAFIGPPPAVSSCSVLLAADDLDLGRGTENVRSADRQL
jgi:hypothetical protein